MSIQALSDDIQSLKAADGSIVIVDLDETLCLRNSSQEFLDLAQPSILAAILLRGMQAIKPWRLTGQDTADCWRVLAVGLLLPWTFLLWRRQIDRFAAQHHNRQLADMLVPIRDRVVIATLGFRPIVEPLVRAMGYGDLPLVACRFGRFADRRQGKFALVERALGADRVASAMVITDSVQDQPLLDRCALPHLLQWPDALYRRALNRPILPFDYLSLIKRPGKSAVKAIFVEDFAIWAIASAPYWTVSAWNAITLFCIFLSFWCVYEIGYADNDRIAAEHETDPTLSDDFSRDATRHAEIRGWTFALLFGALATMTRGRDLMPTLLAQWAVLLVALRLTYAVYNRVDKQSRVWLYAPLQIFRAGAFILLLPINMFGAAFCGALAISRWFFYFLYRMDRTSGAQAKWPEIPQRFVRFLLLLMLLPFALPNAMTAPSSHWIAALIGTGWLALLARRPLLQAIKGTRRIDRVGLSG